MLSLRKKKKRNKIQGQKLIWQPVSAHNTSVSLSAKCIGKWKYL